MNENEHKRCSWCGTTKSEKWRTGFELRRHINYCSNDCRFADEVPCYAIFSILLIVIITIFLIPDFSVLITSLGGFQSWSTIQITLSILTIASIFLLLMGLNVRKRIPKGSRIRE